MREFSRLRPQPIYEIEQIRQVIYTAESGAQEAQIRVKDASVRGGHEINRTKRCSQALRMADTTHVGWKTEPVRDDQGNGLKRRSRPGTGTGELQAKGQGRPVYLYDQLDAAQPLTTLPRHEDDPRFSDGPADGDPPENAANDRPSTR